MGRRGALRYLSARETVRAYRHATTPPRLPGADGAPGRYLGLWSGEAVAVACATVGDLGDRLYAAFRLYRRSKEPMTKTVGDEEARTVTLTTVSIGV
jgi:hypothetical protein